MVKKMSRAESLTGGDRLSIGGRKTDLVRRLQQTHSCLKAISQDDRPEGLAETVEDLVGLGLITHEDRDVRLLVACCLVDVLRVYAPEAPYSPVQLQQIFSLFTQQLRGLSTVVDAEDARSQRTHYILESLATVKSCVILTELSQQGVPGGEEELVSFFECLLSEVREEHSQSVINHVVEALEACLEELDVFTQPLLDVLLVGLLPISRRDVPKMHAVTVQLLRRSFNRICNPISQFLNGVLSGSARGIGGTDSELSEHVLHLIYELHKVNSGFLLYVLPNVAIQLQSEDLGGRGEAMSLLARLFSSTHANYAIDYQKNWNDFLGRFKDVEAGVRGKMVEYGSAILTKKPELRSYLWEHMELRLSDPDWEIRRKTVHELCDLAVNCIDAVNVSIMKKLSERLRDKTLQIRKDTVTGLAQVYARHVSETWRGNRKKEGPPLGEENSSSAKDGPEKDSNIFLQESNTVEDMWPTNVGTDSWEKLHWIPGDVIKCFAYPEPEMKLRVLQLLDEVLLPKLSNKWVRAAGAVYLVSNLDTQAFEGLKRILEYRATLRVEVLHYLQVRNWLRSHPDDATAKKALMSSFETLGHISDKKSAPIQKLNVISDQHVFLRLKAVCAPRLSAAKISEAKADLLKRVGSRSLLGEYLCTLTRSCAMLSFGSDMLSGVLAVLSKSIKIRNVKGIQSALQIITCCAGIHPGELNVPEIASNLLEVVHTAQEAGDEKTLTGVLYALKCIAGRKEVVGCNDSPPQQRHTCELKKVLEANCQKASDLSTSLQKAVLDGKHGEDGSGVIASEAAISLIKVLFPNSEELPRKLINELGKRVTPRGSQSVPALLSLGALFEAFPFLFESCPAGNRVIKFARGVLLDLRSDEGSADSHDCDCCCACITLLGRKLLPSKGDEAARSEAIELLDVLFEIMGEEQMNKLSSHSPHRFSICRESDAKLRLAAALSTLRLMQLGHLQSLLSPQRWKCLGYMLLDKNEILRQAFLKEVCTLVSEAKLPLRFYAYLCLVASSSVEARLALQKGVRSIRLAVAQSQLLKDSGEQSGPIPPTVMVPEYALPYAIYLLAHHPQFNGMGEKNIRKHLVPVVGILRIDGSTDNLSFLFHISETIVSSYCDALSGGDTLSLVSVAQLACEILQLSIKVQDNLSTYPGTIFLPKYLYRPRRPSDGPAPMSSLLTSFYATPSSRVPHGAADRNTRSPKKRPKGSMNRSMEEEEDSGGGTEEEDEEHSEDGDDSDSTESISLERHEDQKMSRSERARVRSDRKSKNYLSVANVEEEEMTVNKFKRNGKENDATPLHEQRKNVFCSAKKKKPRPSL